MKHWKLMPFILIMLPGLLFAEAAQSEEDFYKLSYEERTKITEERFFAASRAGKTVAGVIVEGNSLFNGTTTPYKKPYGDPYTEEELLAAKISAERNSKIFILTADGTLYYPTPKKGQSISESTNSPRIPRVLTEEQKKGPKMFSWATLVPLVGREVEVYGEVYPGYAGVKGIHIESVRFEGLYIVGQE